MANFKYFADTEMMGTIEAKQADYRGNVPFIWSGKEWLKANRTVEYKSNPSKHVCDDRCLHATGRTMKCECSCGGKNHGKGR